MSLRDESVRVVARDPRYPIDAYFFVLEALEYAKKLKYKELRREARGNSRGRRKTSEADKKVKRHVSGQELCRAARSLALANYGGLAKMVLGEWNIRSTSDMGEVVYNLIDAGDLEKTPEDRRADFDRVFDFDEEFLGNIELPEELLD